MSKVWRRGERKEGWMNGAAGGWRWMVTGGEGQRLMAVGGRRGEMGGEMRVG